MPARKWIAHLSPNSPRAQSWLDTFGELRAPILAPTTIRAVVPGFERPQTCYLLDLARLTPAQRSQLVVTLAARFGLTPAEVEQLLERDGCPLLSADVLAVVGAGLAL